MILTLTESCAQMAVFHSMRRNQADGRVPRCPQSESPTACGISKALNLIILTVSLPSVPDLLSREQGSHMVAIPSLISIYIIDMKRVSSKSTHPSAQHPTPHTLFSF